jgi:hypothetical protein
MCNANNSKIFNAFVLRFDNKKKSLKNPMTQKLFSQ